ncbi:MAG: porin family protein [Alphaproteobacteria bacterium]|nr:porin family protein [Alphaproteobacteria bacterium]
MIKKIVLASIITAATVVAANAQRPANDEWRDRLVIINPNQRAEAQNSAGPWYMSAKAALNFANFKNEYKVVEAPVVAGSDRYAGARTIGFEVAGGYQIDPMWRLELAYGYSGEFTDKDAGANFSMLNQTVMANIMANLQQWGTTSVYLGAGFGASILQSHWWGPALGTSSKKSSFNPAGQIIFGAEEQVHRNFALNIQYRILFNSGMKHDVEGVQYCVPGNEAACQANPENFVGTLSTEIENVITHGIMVGARVLF